LGEGTSKSVWRPTTDHRSRSRCGGVLSPMRSTSGGASSFGFYSWAGAAPTNARSLRLYPCLLDTHDRLLAASLYARLVHKRRREVVLASRPFMTCDQACPGADLPPISTAPYAHWGRFCIAFSADGSSATTDDARFSASHRAMPVILASSCGWPITCAPSGISCTAMSGMVTEGANSMELGKLNTGSPVGRGKRGFPG